MKNWKPFLLGLVLLECGIIGFVGGLYALANGMSDKIAFLFALMAVCGLVLALRHLKKED